jgi:UDPglucose--hexose-1-phosphate uridylyltransferase
VSELRRDPLSGRFVAIAPGRATSPGASRHLNPPPDQAELAECPFCAGREDRTPPELLRLGDPWQVRVVPNLYPAVERQEVVVHTPRHARALAELDDPELALVADAWQQRAADRGDAYVHALVNEGPDAGSSLPHTHSQLVWLDEPPPVVLDESTVGENDCPLCRRPSDGLVIAERDGVVLSAAWAGRLPYELLVTPVEHEADPWTSTRLSVALALAADGLRRLRAVEGPRPCNLWLHNSGHWHLEVLPRLTVLAGLELGAGVFVNTLAPEEAAARLRQVATSHPGSAA